MATQNIDEIEDLEIKDKLQLLSSLEKAAWSAGNEYLKWPGKELPKALGSWDEGVLFVSAQENLGKTSWIIQQSIKLLDLNPDLCILDISLDDSFRERTRRYVGCIGRVDTNKVARPALSTEQERNNRKEAYDVLSSYIAKGQLDIKTLAEDKCSTYEDISKVIRNFCSKRPDKKLLVIIDSWHDVIIPEKGDDPEKHALIEISDALKDYKAICIMTAHRRKLSRSEFSRNGTNDELKGSAYVKHFAKVMITIHNEVKIRRENAEIFWVDTLNKEKKLPVLEISVQKNKSCDYDGFIFYYFEPSTGRSVEAAEEMAYAYKNIVYNSLRPR